MIAVIAVMNVKDGSSAEFESAVSDLTAKVRGNEEGTILFQLTRSKTDPNVYKFLELYRDGAAIKAHAATDYFKAALDDMASLLVGKPQIECLDALSPEACGEENTRLD